MMKNTGSGSDTYGNNWIVDEETQYNRVSIACADTLSMVFARPKALDFAAAILDAAGEASLATLVRQTRAAGTPDNEEDEDDAGADDV